MPLSISKLYQSVKSKVNNRRKSESSTATSGSNESTTSKSVRFSSDSAVICDTYSREEYDRRSSIFVDPQHEGDSLLKPSEQEDDEEEGAAQISEEVMRNTKVNRKQGPTSIY